MRCRAIKLKDSHFDNFHTEVNGRWNYDDFVGGKNRKWYEDWISFTALLADDARNTLWCGLASFTGDIFYRYDRGTGKFQSLNFQSVGDKYDAKFHQGLFFDRRGAIWAATAALHDVDRYWDAPGGAIVRFWPQTEELQVAARPMPHLYIQGVALDDKRGVMYGITFTPERLFRFDMADGKVTDLGPIGNGVALCQGANVAVDRTGACWGTWGATRAWLSTPGPDMIRLWRYHPDRPRIEFLKTGLPRLHGETGTAAADAVHTGPDGAVYMGTAEGLLCRIDPDTHQVRAVGKPGPAARLAAMTNGPDGKLYGSAGKDGSIILFSYDPARDRLRDLGPVFDHESHERAWHLHSLTMFKDGVIYAGENDVPHRSGYLWEITGAAE
jgi:hypothetical protein